MFFFQPRLLPNFWLFKEIIRKEESQITKLLNGCRCRLATAASGYSATLLIHFLSSQSLFLNFSSLKTSPMFLFVCVCVCTCDVRFFGKFTKIRQIAVIYFNNLSAEHQAHPPSFIKVVLKTRLFGNRGSIFLYFIFTLAWPYIVSCVWSPSKTLACILLRMTDTLLEAQRCLTRSQTWWSSTNAKASRRFRATGCISNR